MANTHGPGKPKKVTSPNIQTLGNIQFDSNKSVDKDGFIVVKDIKTGKDFSVLRNNDGSYRWHDGTPLTGEAFLKANQNEKFNNTFINMLSKFSNDSNGKINKASEYLNKLNEYSHKRINGKLSPEEREFRETLASKIDPHNYEPATHLMELEGNQTHIDNARNPFWRFYLGLDPANGLKYSEFNPSQNSNGSKKYFTSKYPNFKQDIIKDYFNEDTKSFGKLGKSKNNIVVGGQEFGTNPLGNYTIGRGLDNKGEYISGYDKWDLDPFGETSYIGGSLAQKLAPNINNLMNPFEVYDRQYLSELPQSTQDSIHMFDKTYGIIPKDNTTMKNKKQYATGGQLGLEDLTSMMGMFGPIGSAIGTGMNVINTLTQPTPIPQATSYKNTNAFGYATGGDLDQIPNQRQVPAMSHEQLMQIVHSIVGAQQQGVGMQNQPSEFTREFSTQDQQPQQQVQAVRQQTRTAPTQNSISKLQEKLLSLGYTGIGKKGEVMSIDGVLGGRTRAALKKALDNGQVSTAYKKYLDVENPKKPVLPTPPVTPASIGKKEATISGDSIPTIIASRITKGATISGDSIPTITAKRMPIKNYKNPKDFNALPDNHNSDMQGLNWANFQADNYKRFKNGVINKSAEENSQLVDRYDPLTGSHIRSTYNPAHGRESFGGDVTDIGNNILGLFVPGGLASGLLRSGKVANTAENIANVANTGQKLLNAGKATNTAKTVSQSGKFLGQGSKVVEETINSSKALNSGQKMLNESNNFQKVLNGATKTSTVNDVTQKLINGANTASKVSKSSQAAEDIAFLTKAMEQAKAAGNYKKWSALKGRIAAYGKDGRYAFATGGDLSNMGNGAYQVQGDNPNVTDGVGVNVGGQQVQLDHNEVLDKDKVISDKFFNPLTGKKIVDEYAKLVRAQKNATDRTSYHKDPIAARTNELMENQKNDLFKLQEMIATMKGQRNQDGSTVQQAQQAYAYGGPFDPRQGLQMMRNAPQMPYDVPDVSYDPTNYSRSPYGELNQLPQRQSNILYNNLSAVERLPQRTADMVGNTPNYSIGLRAQGIGPAGSNNRPSLDGVAGIVGSMSQQPQSQQSHAGFWDQFTQGDKIGMGVTALSMIPKAISAFQPVQKEPYRTINAPITQQQLDPTNALYNSSNEYRSQLYNTNNNTSTINNANALRANAYASKLNADNQILSQYENTNKGLQTDYQNRLGQRQAVNNQSMMQTDDLNSRNQATARNRQMGLYNDIAGGGQTLGNSLNQREHDKIALASMQKMAPDVFGGYMDQLPLLKYLKEQMMTSASKGK